MRSDPRRAVIVWLIVCCTLVFAMVVLGGVTRLTRSGLSIVEWQPIVGTLPPLTDTQWEETFAKYRQTPEYLKVNLGMSLAEFKSIFWVEYAHRLLGRTIGLAFLLPLLYFLARKQIERRLAPKLIALFVLGGLQGALGWYMVASGLVDNPHVSPYRLTAHLGLAVLIYGYMLWIVFDLARGAPAAGMNSGVRRYAWGYAALVFVMILSGGFVAGTRAGFAFNTFPLMNGAWIPPGALALEPWWRNLFENVATVQLDHRLIAYVLIATGIGLWLAVRRGAAMAQAAATLLLAALALQVLLGITTLLWVVPIPLAAAHQAGALIVFTAALYLAHTLRGIKR